MRMGAYTTNPTSTEDGEFVFGHDYMSRRVSKQVPSWDAALNDGEGDWHPTLVLDQRYVYDGWNVVLVLDGLDDNAVVRKYSWGLDLSGQSGDASSSGIHGAGGIGGLLAAVETSGTHAGSYWFLYDANGNVGQVLNATDPQSITPAAQYEYDPYGNRVAKSGTYADYNPFRFSTKWRDDETGLYYYGYRYYSPGLGRWISRDPIGEEGGLTLYAFVHNNTLTGVDAHGLQAMLSCKQVCGQCADACMAAIGCAPGDGFFGGCPETKKWPCKKTRSNCHLACQLCGSPTNRCGGKAWRKACSTGSHVAVSATGITAGAAATHFYKCGATRVCRVCSAVAGVAVLVEIKNVWNTALAVYRPIAHAEDYDECIQSLNRWDTCHTSDDCAALLG